ncbi:HinT-interacting membrane complex lipoprotein P60 [Mycoplasma seminis]|uniref:P60-like lipoprotein n=1 Tax=Mycoplasma seminis TaxID=512749 RepID=A0ABY9HAE1_9MOLU|nr:hypothetical protein [Mycoplasma seminis]WLP85565.1 hypothetical protein Q8852_00095 [Mycoplasma seminis]
MKAKFRNLLLAAPIATIPLAAVSCGVDKDTPEKVKQDLILKSEQIKNIVEDQWMQATLKSLYNVEQTAELISNATYKAEALAAYQALVANENLKNSFYLLTQINTWASLGILTKDDITAFSDFLNGTSANIKDAYNKANVNEEQFIRLYSNKQTKVAFAVNKLLLVNKYFQISSLADLEKIDSSSTSLYKNKFQLNQFNLINYVINNKSVQLWKYEDTNANNLFTMSSYQIKDIKNYEGLIKKSTAINDTATSALLINPNATWEINLGGYKGITSNPYEMSYKVDDLLNLDANKNLVGFYDFTNNKLVSVAENGTLQTPVNVSSDGKKIEVAYMSLILPLAKKTTEKVTEDGKEVEKEKSILSFDETVYKDNLSQLRLILAVSDDKLYAKAQKAFADLGYLAHVDKNIKEITKGMPIVAK